MNQPRIAKDVLYTQRLSRYVTALRNEKPDCIPIRPFVAEFAGRYAGYTCQEVTHDYELALDAIRRCALDFDWDAVVGNLVYVWTGLTEAIGLEYYAIPGVHVPADVGFQYREPARERAYMRPDEYDALIADPTAFLYNVWLPRAARDVVAPGEPASYRSHLSFVKGGMAMQKYFAALGNQTDRLRTECGTVSAIAGILKAPFDILADKLRGYLGLTKDMATQPAKVRAACDALLPHLLHVALTSADPARQVPIGFWMHRGCVPFIKPAQFDSHYWPTLRPIIEELWARGHQTLFYAEGDWSYHLDRFAELPERSIVYHVDRGDIATVHRKLGHKFCLSGGLPNYLLATGTPAEVRACCKKIIDTVARDGGYIMDASAIIQNDAQVGNVRAMTEFTREYGVYSTGATRLGEASTREGEPSTREGEPPGEPGGRSTSAQQELRPVGAPPPRAKPDVCIPWDQKRRELPALSAASEEIVRRVWEDVDALGHMYIWHCLLSF